VSAGPTGRVVTRPVRVVGDYELADDKPLGADVVTARLGVPGPARLRDGPGHGGRPLVGSRLGLVDGRARPRASLPAAMISGKNRVKSVPFLRRALRPCR
jgi:hypothetical protein